ncbi:LacI family transcriptional regulator (plasmid) [Rhizobium ruizarguesonis]|uniref:LacI family DNA-binding transcriptional regulator n=1 Tax=Rhizobium ruizarguesonis TaxID=2081791 RepID=UPI00103575DE|nr:LacI family DNA-binding transcriptional regulator [Rhizobium ruizarguesonis]TBD33495.1 LacI family transcriptional regulator [Rhizobium ruizarguesonis]
MPRRKKQEITLKDVAAAAGVSVMSVSNVVNERWDLVSDRTRAVIEKEIKRLQYQPQMAGRSLRTGKTNTLGLVVLQGEDGVRPNRRAQAIIAGFLESTAGHGYTVSHIFRRHSTIETAIGSLSQRVDGIAMLIDESIEVRKKDVAILSSFGIPIVELEGLRLVELEDACSIHERADTQINTLATSLSKSSPGNVYFLTGKDHNEHAMRRYRLLKANPGLRHFQFHSKMELKSLFDFEGEKTAAIFVATEADYCDLVMTFPASLQCALISKIVCLDADAYPSGTDRQSNLPGFHSVAFRVGNVGGNALLARLSSTTFTYRQIGVDCGIVLPALNKPDR